MARVSKLAVSSVVLFVACGLVIAKVLLPGSVGEAVEAELEPFREFAEITYETVDIDLAGKVTLEDVAFRHKAVPMAGAFGTIEIANDESFSATSLSFEREGMAFTADRLAIARLDAQRAEHVILDNPSWRWTDEVGEHRVEASRLTLDGLDHAYLWMIDDAWHGDMDGLLAEAPDGLILGLVAEDVAVWNMSTADKTWRVQELRVHTVENAELIDVELLGSEGSLEDQDVVFGAITLDRLPLWLVDGWEKFERACMARPDCGADPVAAAGQEIVGRIVERGGLDLGALAFDDGRVIPRDDTLSALEDLTLSLRDLKISINDQSRAYLESVAADFSGIAPIDGLGARERAFLGPAGIENDIRFRATSTSSTDIDAGTARGTWHAELDKLGTLDVGARVADVPADHLDLAMYSPTISPFTHLLTSDGRLADADLHFTNDGAIELFLDSAAAHLGLERENVVAVLVQQLRTYAITLGPKADSVIAELIRFLENPKDITLRLNPESPVPLSDFLTLQATQPLMFLDQLGVTVEANR